MHSYSLGDWQQVLNAVGIRPGDTVFLHSALFMLGRLEGHPLRDIPRALGETLLDHLGTNGTLVVPTFNFGFCDGKSFDRQHTPSAQMGPLAEYVRRHPQSCRSPHAFQSVAAMGKHAESFCRPDPASAFDDDGPFGQLLDFEGTVLLVGVGIRMASLVHFVEQKAHVPYRYWKTFEGTYIDQGHTTRKAYRMYARNLEVDPQLGFDFIDRTLRERGDLHEARLGGGTVKAFKCRDFVDTALRALQEDPYCLLANDEEVRAYYA